jgi:phosphohistidine phosphatase
MELYLLRHGEAEPHSIEDSRRQLTAKGKRDVRAVCRRAWTARARPQILLTSPLIRAKETARIAADVLEVKKVSKSKSLLPDASPETLWRELEKLPASGQILLAGHEPAMSRLAGFLLGGSTSVDFKKGALMRISVNGSLPGVLKWMITPRLARLD